jgi:hypothetical protein
MRTLALIAGAVAISAAAALALPASATPAAPTVPLLADQQASNIEPLRSEESSGGITTGDFTVHDTDFVTGITGIGMADGGMPRHGGSPGRQSA